MFRAPATSAFSFLALLAMLLCAPAVSTHAQARGTTPEPAPAAPTANGKYYALVIGIDEYPAPLPKLKTAANDAREVAKVLSDRYGFDVKLLLNGEASRGNILDSLNQYESSVTADDNLLIYFAGHGYENKLTGKAYWLPADASSITSSNRIIADDITSEMVALPARHILIVSDSCYSGGLSRDADVVSATLGKDTLLRRMASGHSRTLMASGGDEPVSDSGKEGHSAFAYALLEALKARQDAMFSAGDLFYAGVQRRVAGNSEQVPHYDVIRSSGHVDGDFVFLRKGATADTASVVFHPETSPVDDLKSAQATYYTPTTSGLRSFQCSVKPDWKSILSRSSSSVVTENDPSLVYLNGVHMSVKDDLMTAGTMDWNETTPPSADAAPAIGKVRSGTNGMLVGFFQTWNGFMNGTLMPEPDNSTQVTRDGSGIHVHGGDTTATVDESFDKDMTLSEYHVVTKDMDVMMYPTYSSTSDGKILSSLRSVYRASSAPGTELTMSVTYSTVDSFSIPATLLIDEKNVGKFQFTFSDCTVNKL